jgi:hypothetical protein
MLTEELYFDYVIRFRGNIAVTATTEETRTAAAWVRPHASRLVPRIFRSDPPVLVAPIQRMLPRLLGCCRVVVGVSRRYGTCDWRLCKYDPRESLTLPDVAHRFF